MPRLLVTGCGRSGTAYMARVLQAHGLDIGHEQAGADGTVDWHAAAKLDEFTGCIVVHQVRHPLHVIASITTASPRSWRFIARHIRLTRNATRLQHAAEYWLYWNQLVEQRCTLCYQVEKLASWLDELLMPFGRTVNHELLAQISTSLNTRRDRYTPVTWDDVAMCDKALCTRVYDKARQYGYLRDTTEGANSE